MSYSAEKFTESKLFHILAKAFNTEEPLAFIIRVKVMQVNRQHYAKAAQLRDLQKVVQATLEIV